MKLAFALYGRPSYECFRDISKFGQFEISYPWLKGEHVLILGEISNMPGHVVVARKNGTIHFGYHDDNFLIYSDGEMHSTCEDNGFVSLGLEEHMLNRTDPHNSKKVTCLSLSKLSEIKKTRGMPNNL